MGSRHCRSQPVARARSAARAALVTWTGLVACAALTACVALAAACAPTPPKPPGQGGPAWVEVKTVHFTLWTDTSVERGRRIVRDLERRRQVVTAAMGGSPRNMMSFVVALSGARELAAYQPWGVYGAAWAPWFAQNPTGQPGIVFDAARQDNDEVVAHELTHVIMYGAFGRQPTWLAEGIASYFETANVELGDDSSRIGLPAADRIMVLRRRVPLPVDQLFACHDHRCMDTWYYASCWALVSYLVNSHYDEFANYLKLSNERPAEQDLDTWRAAFPDLPLDRIDDILNDWTVNGQFRLPRVHFALRDHAMTARPLGDADVLAVRSFLRMMFVARDAAVGDDTRAALALDRTNLLARLIQTELTHAITAAEARATAAAHLDDWRAWWLVELARGGRAEVALAHQRLCELAENTAPRCKHTEASPDR